MKTTVIIWFFLAVSNANFGQSDLQKAEGDINKVFSLIASASSDAEKQQLHDSISVLLDKALQLPDAFRYPFDSLKFLGNITSTDQQVRIFTWNNALKDGRNDFFGFLMYRKGREIDVYKLNNTDSSSENWPATTETINWPGCLIYEIIEKKISGETVYTYLGYRPRDLFVTQKIIDVLWFENNMPFFGKPIFVVNKKLQSRVIFRYSAKARMSLVWNKNLDMIVFDHLSPTNPSMTGNYQFYAPDSSFDGFKLENGIWTLRENIDVRN